MGSPLRKVGPHYAEGKNIGKRSFTRSGTMESWNV